MNEEDFYSVLGVSPTASLALIKERFRFLSHAYHPDKFATEPQRRTAETEFKRINQAYQILSDASQRARFDASRPTPPPKTPSSPPPRPSSPSSPPSPTKPTTDKSAYSWVTTVVGIVAFFAVRYCNDQRREERRSAPPPLAPPAAAQEIRRGTVKNGNYHNEFFAFTVQVPSNWEPMAAQELSEEQAAGREFIGQQSANLQQRLHSAEARYLVLFRMRPQSEAGWSVLPGFSAIAESILPNRTAEDYLRLAQRSFEQLQGVSLVPSSSYQLQCRGRSLTAVDFATKLKDTSGHMSMLISIERGYALSFILSAGDKQTLESLKAIAGEISFQ